MTDNRRAVNQAGKRLQIPQFQKEASKRIWEGVTGMREPTRKGEVEEESRAQTSRTVGIASVSGELMREITSRGERGCLLAGERGDRNAASALAKWHLRRWRGVG